MLTALKKQKKAWDPSLFHFANYSPKRSLIRADLPERSRK